MSTPGRFARVKELFDTACDLPRAERDAYLAEQCGDDAELRQEVEKLLSFEDTGDGALGGELRGAGPAFLAEELAATEFVEGNQPTQIDKYRIIREIGHGGMGIVYEAEQENPRRSVALKVIRSAFATADLYKRFRAEAQLLGRLDHPGIAHIYEAGSAEVAGRSCPFFAMEYIEGQPLDRHVRDGQLSRNAILELMALVCDAVSYAHQRGIIHRDLKPANILVKQERELTSTGDNASMTPRTVQPKVLDFGIARVTNSDFQVTSIRTHAGQIVGTLAYMSPEQVAGRGDLDVRCDVYALGVILYEILSGKRPFDLAGKSMAEAARIIEDVEGTDLASQVPAIPGDIATIVAKAMEKDRERRYRSAAELGEDLRRYLRSEPILARPPSAAYQLRKFARRNRALVLGVGATIVALAAGLVAATAGFLSARAERDAKVQALETSDAVTEFLSNMLQATNPGEQGREVTVREVLDNAAQDVGTTFADRPAVEARLRMVIAYTYVGLGQYASADSHAVAAIQSLSRVPNPDLDEQAVGHSLLGQIRYFEGEYEDAEEEFARALAIEQSRDEVDAQSVALGLSNIAFLTMRRGQYEKARVKFSEALAYADKGFGPDDATSLDILGNMAMLDLRMERYEEAEAVYKDVIARYRRVRGDEHPQTVLFIANLGVVYLRQEEFAKAEELFREALAIQERVIGPTHSQTLITLGSLAGALAGQGKTDEAMELIQEGLRRSIETYGVDEPSTIYLRVAEGRVLELSNQSEKAYAQVAQTLSDGKRILGPESDVCFDVWKRLFRLQEELGKDQAHLAAATDLVNSLGPIVGENDERVRIGHLEMGEAYRALGRFDESERQLLLVHETGDSTTRVAAAAELSALYKDWDRPEDAARYASGNDDAPVPEGSVE